MQEKFSHNQSGHSKLCPVSTQAPQQAVSQSGLVGAEMLKVSLFSGSAAHPLNTTPQELQTVQENLAHTEPA